MRVRVKLSFSSLETTTFVPMLQEMDNDKLLACPLVRSCTLYRMDYSRFEDQLLACLCALYDML
jgi:hypothetical protein